MKDDRLLTLADVAARYAMAPKVARRHIKARDGRVPVPCQEKPYKFKASVVDAHFNALGIVEQRQHVRKRQVEGARA